MNSNRLSSLFVKPHLRRLGHQVVPKRHKGEKTGNRNKWGTGYSNFGHEQPDHFPPITKVFHLFVGLGMFLPVLDWRRFGPLLEAKYNQIKKALSMGDEDGAN